VVKIPIIGQHFVKEIPASDNVCVYFHWVEAAVVLVEV
jgi:hypothetical protein